MHEKGVVYAFDFSCSFVWKSLLLLRRRVLVSKANLRLAGISCFIKEKVGEERSSYLNMRFLQCDCWLGGIVFTAYHPLDRQKLGELEAWDWILSLL